jgi:hypothetical protein
MAGLNPQYEQNRWVMRGRLGHNPDAGVHYGRWFKLACTRPFTITIGSGETDGTIATVTIYVSNGLDEPPQLSAAPVRGAAPLEKLITLSQTLTYDLPYEWIAVTIAAGKRTMADLAAG